MPSQAILDAISDARRRQAEKKGARVSRADLQVAGWHRPYDDRGGTVKPEDFLDLLPHPPHPGVFRMPRANETEAIEAAAEAICKVLQWLGYKTTTPGQILRTRLRTLQARLILAIRERAGRLSSTTVPETRIAKYVRHRINEAVRRLVQAELTADLDGLIKAIASGAPASFYFEHTGETVVTTLMRFSNPAYLEKAIKLGADVNQRTIDGVTPAVVSIAVNEAPLTRVLLECGADPNARVVFGDPTHEGDGDEGEDATPLMLAAARGAIISLKVFLLHSATNINAVSTKGRSALMFAARFGQTETVRQLIVAGALVTQRDDFGFTAADWFYAALQEKKRKRARQLALEEAERREKEAAAPRAADFDALLVKSLTGADSVYRGSDDFAALLKEEMAQEDAEVSAAVAADPSRPGSAVGAAAGGAALGGFGSASTASGSRNQSAGAGRSGARGGRGLASGGKSSGRRTTFKHPGSSGGGGGGGGSGSGDDGSGRSDGAAEGDYDDELDAGGDSLGDLRSADMSLFDVEAESEGGRDGSVRSVISRVELPVRTPGMTEWEVAEANAAINGMPLPIRNAGRVPGLALGQTATPAATSPRTSAPASPRAPSADRTAVKSALKTPSSASGPAAGGSHGTPGTPGSRDGGGGDEELEFSEKVGVKASATSSFSTGSNKSRGVAALFSGKDLSGEDAITLTDRQVFRALLMTIQEAEEAGLAASKASETALQLLGLKGDDPLSQMLCAKLDYGLLSHPPLESWPAHIYLRSLSYLSPNIQQAPKVPEALVLTATTRRGPDGAPAFDSKLTRDLPRALRAMEERVNVAAAAGLKPWQEGGPPSTAGTFQTLGTLSTTGWGEYGRHGHPRGTKSVSYQKAHAPPNGFTGAERPRSLHSRASRGTAKRWGGSRSGSRSRSRSPRAAALATAAEGALGPQGSLASLSSAASSLHPHSSKLLIKVEDNGDACERCLKPGTAVVRCMDCPRNLCKVCSAQMHIAEGMRWHRIRPLKPGMNVLDAVVNVPAGEAVIGGVYTVDEALGLKDVPTPLVRAVAAAEEMLAAEASQSPRRRRKAGWGAFGRKKTAAEEEEEAEAEAAAAAEAAAERERKLQDAAIAHANLEARRAGAKGVVQGARQAIRSLEVLRASMTGVERGPIAASAGATWGLRPETSQSTARGPPGFGSPLVRASSASSFGRSGLGSRGTMGSLGLRASQTTVDSARMWGSVGGATYEGSMTASITDNLPSVDPAALYATQPKDEATEALEKLYNNITTTISASGLGALRRFFGKGPGAAEEAPRKTLRMIPGGKGRKPVMNAAAGALPPGTGDKHVSALNNSLLPPRSALLTAATSLLLGEPMKEDAFRALTKHIDGKAPAVVLAENKDALRREAEERAAKLLERKAAAAALAEAAAAVQQTMMKYSGASRRNSAADVAAELERQQAALQAEINAVTERAKQLAGGSKRAGSSSADVTNAASASEVTGLDEDITGIDDDGEEQEGGVDGDVEGDGILAEEVEAAARAGSPRRAAPAPAPAPMASPRSARRGSLVVASEDMLVAGAPITITAEALGSGSARGASARRGSIVVAAGTSADQTIALLTAGAADSPSRRGSVAGSGRRPSAVAAAFTPVAGEAADSPAVVANSLEAAAAAATAHIPNASSRRRRSSVMTEAMLAGLAAEAGSPADSSRPEVVVLSDRRAQAQDAGRDGASALERLANASPRRATIVAMELAAEAAAAAAMEDIAARKHVLKQLHVHAMEEAGDTKAMVTVSAASLAAEQALRAAAARRRSITDTLAASDFAAAGADVMLIPSATPGRGATFKLVEKPGGRLDETHLQVPALPDILPTPRSRRGSLAAPPGAAEAAAAAAFAANNEAAPDLLDGIVPPPPPPGPPPSGAAEATSGSASAAPSNRNKSGGPPSKDKVRLFSWEKTLQARRRTRNKRKVLHATHPLVVARRDKMRALNEAGITASVLKIVARVLGRDPSLDATKLGLDAPTLTAIQEDIKREAALAQRRRARRRSSIMREFGGEGGEGSAGLLQDSDGSGLGSDSDGSAPESREDALRQLRAQLQSSLAEAYQKLTAPASFGSSEADIPELRLGREYCERGKWAEAVEAYGTGLQVLVERPVFDAYAYIVNMLRYCAALRAAGHLDTAQAALADVSAQLEGNGSLPHAMTLWTWAVLETAAHMHDSGAREDARATLDAHVPDFVTNGFPVDVPQELRQSMAAVAAHLGLALPEAVTLEEVAAEQVAREAAAATLGQSGGGAGGGGARRRLSVFGGASPGPPSEPLHALSHDPTGATKVLAAAAAGRANHVSSAGSYDLHALHPLGHPGFSSVGSLDVPLAGPDGRRLDGGGSSTLDGATDSRSASLPSALDDTASYRSDTVGSAVSSRPDTREGAPGSSRLEEEATGRAAAASKGATSAAAPRARRMSLPFGGTAAAGQAARRRAVPVWMGALPPAEQRRHVAALDIQRLLRGHLGRKRVIARTASYWLPRLDASSGFYYYLNLATGESRWTPPPYLPASAIGFKVVCGDCSAALATTFCGHCDASFCDPCNRAYHAKAGRSGHARCKVDATSDPVCSHCETRLGYVYCYGCSCTSCGQCDVGAHPDGTDATAHSKITLPQVQALLTAAGVARKAAGAVPGLSKS